MAFVVWVVIALQTLAFAHAPPTTPTRVEREAWVMGTRLRVVVEESLRPAALASAERTLREIERMERLLSTWDTSTVLSRLNRSRPGRAVHAGPELGALLRESERWMRRTGRAFDPTIGALVDVWGLRKGGAVPEPAGLTAALAASGPSAIVVGAEAASAGATTPQVTVLRRSSASWIDSGAFGKGAALRAVAELHESKASVRVFVDLGGQLLLIGSPDAPFLVEVAHPGNRRESVATLTLSRGSVATSGASERPGHLLDPRTGRPVDAWGSVTVVADDALEADILSTALYVMGLERGRAWAERNGTAALFLEWDGEKIKPAWTSALERSLHEAPVVSSVENPTKGLS